MDEPRYEYRGLMASTWDFFRGDTSTAVDKVFFQKLIDQFGQPVLDVGCGTGRLLLDYIDSGIDIDGVDNSPEMLALCRQKAMQRGLKVTVYEQWMEELQLPRFYKLIIVPSYSFQLVTDETLAEQAMSRFFEHLEARAVLAVPFFISTLIDSDYDPNEWHLLKEKISPEDGAILRNWIRGHWDKRTQLQHTENRYEVELQGEIVKSETIKHSPALRWYTQSQAKILFESVGFKLSQIYKGHSFELASETDTNFVILAQKPR